MRGEPGGASRWTAARWIRAAVFACAALAIAGCSRGGAPADGEARPGATPGARGTPVVGATATPRPATATPAPTPAPTPGPAPPPAPTPSPARPPAPTPPPARPPGPLAGGEGALWVGPSPQPGGLWFALRITPGADPARDPWRFESGPLGGRPFECTPTREAAGIRLGSCGPNPAWPDFALSLPDVGAGEEARLVVRGGGGQATVTRAWVRDEPQASPNVTLLWHHEARDLGSHGDVWSDGDVVIATHSSGWIELLDAETGAVRGRVDARVGFAAPGYGNGITDAKTRDGTLYLGTDARGVLIFDIRDRASPLFLGQYAVPHGSAPVPFVNVHNMYLAPDAPLLVAINTSYEQTDLRLIDVADPIAPREAGRFQLPTGSTFSEGVHDVHVVVRDGRRIAYVHAMLNGFLVLDVSDPAAIRTLGSITWEGIFSHSGWAFGAGGRHYYAHNDEGPDQGMTVIDVTDLARPRVVSRFSTRKGISVHDVEVHDGIAYVAYYIDGLRAVDLRDPARPREVAHFDTVPASREADVLQGAWSVHVARGRVFVSDMETGVYAFRVTVP